MSVSVTVRYRRHAVGVAMGLLTVLVGLGAFLFFADSSDSDPIGTSVGKDCDQGPTSTGERAVAGSSSLRTSTASQVRWTAPSRVGITGGSSAKLNWISLRTCGHRSAIRSGESPSNLAILPFPCELEVEVGFEACGHEFTTHLLSTVVRSPEEVLSALAATAERTISREDVDAAIERFDATMDELHEELKAEYCSGKQCPRADRFRTRYLRASGEQRAARDRCFP